MKIQRFFFSAALHGLFLTKLLVTACLAAEPIRTSQSLCPTTEDVNPNVYFNVLDYKQDTDFIYLLSFPIPNCTDLLAKTVAKSSILSLFTPTPLREGELLRLAHNGIELSALTSNSKGGGSRLMRSWKITTLYNNIHDSDKTREQPISRASFLFNLKELGMDGKKAGNFLLLVGKDGSLNNATYQQTSGRMQLSSHTVFQGVTFSNGDVVTLVVNYLEDTDLDGISNVIERKFGTNPSDPKSVLDSDKDGVPDHQDVDADGDGVSNTQEYFGVNPYEDKNNNGILNFLDAHDNGTTNSARCPDADSNAICDSFDISVDSNQNGVPNFMEANKGTTSPTIYPSTPTSSPTIRPSTPSPKPTIQSNTPPTTPTPATTFNPKPSPTATLVIDPEGDTDKDGILNRDECPQSSQCTDTDGDGLANYKDSDDDNDSIETINEIGNDPSNPFDSDYDTIPDYLEPNNVDSDNDGKANNLDNNDDNDSLHTLDEVGMVHTAPTDSDSDRVPNYLEPDELDTDMDTISNPEDSDDDGDAKPTFDELSGSALYPLDRDEDGIPDYLDSDSGREVGGAQDNNYIVKTNAGIFSGSLSWHYLITLFVLTIVRSCCSYFTVQKSKKPQ